MTSLVDKTISEVLTQQKKLHSDNYFDNIVSGFKIGQGRVNDLNIDLLKFDFPAFKPNVTSFHDNVITQATANPKPLPKPIPKPIPLQNYKVENFKPIKIENAFGSTIVKSEVQPLVHKNPQKYEYLLNKYDVQDIAMKRLDIEHGYENEYSKIFEDFYNNQYLSSIESNEINIDVLKAFEPKNVDEAELKARILANPESKHYIELASTYLKDNKTPLFIDKDKDKILSFVLKHESPSDSLINFLNNHNEDTSKKVPADQIYRINNTLKLMKIPYKIPHGSTIDAAINQIQRLEKNGTFLKLKKSKLGPFSEGFKMPKGEEYIEKPEDFKDIPADDNNIAGGGGAPSGEKGKSGGGAPSGEKGKSGGGAPSGLVAINIKSNISKAEAEKLISDGMTETIQNSITELINLKVVTKEIIDDTIQEMSNAIEQLIKSNNTNIGTLISSNINKKLGIINFVTHQCGVKSLTKKIKALQAFKVYLNNPTSKSPQKSPSKSPQESPSKSPQKSPSKSPQESPSKSPKKKKKSGK
jgi:hypothetical protein